MFNLFCSGQNSFGNNFDKRTCANCPSNHEHYADFDGRVNTQVIKRIKKPKLLGAQKHIVDMILSCPMHVGTDTGAEKSLLARLST